MNQTVQLKATVTGKSKTVKWTTKDKSIATVTKNGKVKGIKPGKVMITATANGVKAACEVTVKIKHPTYSQYFMVKPQKSSYGNKTIDEYGVRLQVNDGAVVKKCAVYLKKIGNSYYRTIACTGTNISYARYVPYLARNGKIIYDGTKTSGIYTFGLSQDRNGIWSYKGCFSTVKANLTDSKGNQLAVKSTGVAGKNTKIFYDRDEMIAWLKK